MLCKDPSEFTKGMDKIKQRWSNSRTLKEWNLINDTKFFKELFFDATNKDFELGVELNYKDLNKFDIMLDSKIQQLKSPGDMASKFKKIMWVGYAKAMKNPIVKSFFHTLSDANNFRNRVTAQNNDEFRNLIADFKDAIVLYEGGNDISGLKTKITRKDRFTELTDILNQHEKNYAQQKIFEGKGEDLNSSDAYYKLDKFLSKEGEGVMFQDFLEVLETGTTKSLRVKYANELEYRNNYINKLDVASSRWKTIVGNANKDLSKSIDNLIDIVNLKYGEKTNAAVRLIERYKEVKSNLQKSKDKGYAPHYVLDLLKQSLEMREKLDLNTELSKSEMDDLFNQFVKEVDGINTTLSDRLKSRSGSGIETEYFTRNPMLYVDQFIKDVGKFNHSSTVDKAYLLGIKKLSEVAFSNPGKQTGEAAESYMKYMMEMYNDAIKGRGIQDSPVANNIHRLLSSMQFVSKLGWNFKSPIKNYSQSLFTWKWFGHTEMKHAMNEFKSNPNAERLLNDMMTKYGYKFFDLGTVTEGAITDISLEGFGVSYKNGYLTRQDQISVLDHMTKAGVKVAGKSAIFMQWAENFNRKHTFKRAFGSRLRQLRQQNRFIEKDINNPETQTAMGKEAGKYAARVTELLHFVYSPHGKSELLKSKAGSLLFQFQHYTKSAINLEAMIFKDAWKAYKAGENLNSYEFKRMYRSVGLAMIANAISIPFGVNVTSYIGNEILSKIGDFTQFITGSEEEKKNAFYGRGPLVSQSVVLSDMVEVFNLGLSKGWYDLQVDPDGIASLMTGIREYEDMSDADLNREMWGKLMPNVELDRFTSKTLPAFTKSGFPGVLRAQFGLYPGETELGIDVRKTRKKILESDTMQGASELYEKAFGTGLIKKSKKKEKKSFIRMNSDERRRALQSLSKF